MVALEIRTLGKHFIASNNLNNVVTRYLENGAYDVKPSIQTIFNAMDVGNPSNFIRIQKIYSQLFQCLKRKLIFLLFYR